MIKIAYIDHYDSFSFNLIEWLKQGKLPLNIEYYQYDSEGLESKLLSNPCPIAISPGPNSPLNTASTNKIVEKMLGQVPILGVCLGHQILAYTSGAKIVKSVSPTHGEVRKVNLNRSRLIGDDRSDLEIAAYNSLVVKSDFQDKDWKITGKCENDEIQMIENWKNPECPAIGVQFHPESFLSLDGNLFLEKWLSIVESWYRTKA